MQLEFHQLDRRLEHLRVRHPARQRRLLASLAEVGQQTPSSSSKLAARYLVIDGTSASPRSNNWAGTQWKRVVWEMSEAEACCWTRSLRMQRAGNALEQGWLLAEMEQRFGYSLEELARRFDRSMSWVSRRLALVETLPEAMQQQVREGKIAAQVAMRYLVPVARISRKHCQRMAARFRRTSLDTRQAGAVLSRLARGQSHAMRERILAEPELFREDAKQQAAADNRNTLESDLNQIIGASRNVRWSMLEAPTPNRDADRSARSNAPSRLLTATSSNASRSTETNHAEPSATHHDSGTERARE